MATSGSYDFTLNKTNIITHALRKANVISDRQTPDAAMMDYASNELNIMIKTWQAEGIPLWNRLRGHLFTTNDDEKYSVGPSGDHATKSYVSTTLDAAEAASQTILSVTSTTGFNNSDNIGIELDDGTRQWTTISSFVTNDTVTVADALTGAAASGNTIIVYTSLMQRPLRILQMTYEDITDGSEVTVSPISFDQYFSYPNKDTEGPPSNYYYHNTLDNGTLYLYPRPNNPNYILNFIYHESFEDMDATTDNADFPTEWLDPLVLNLAVRLGKHYGKYIEMKELEQDAIISKLNAQWFNCDEEDIHISVNM